MDRRKVRPQRVSSRASSPQRVRYVSPRTTLVSRVLVFSTIPTVSGQAARMRRTSSSSRGSSAPFTTRQTRACPAALVRT